MQWKSDCNSEALTTGGAEDIELQIRGKNEFDSGVLYVFYLLCTTLCLLRDEVVPDLLFSRLLFHLLYSYKDKGVSPDG